MFRSRAAVSFAFFINGIVLGTWAGHIPGIQDKFSLTEADLGLILLTIGLGAVTTMPVTGWMIHRFGSRGMTIVASLLFAAFLIPMYWVDSLYHLYIAAFLLGGANGSMDMAMNDQAIILEQRYQRSIMSSFHGIFSVGGLIGSGLAAIFLWLEGTPLLQSVSIMFVLLITACVLFPYLIDTKQKSIEEAATQKKGLQLSPTLLLLSMIALIVFMSEGAIADWGALYLREIAGSSEAEAALGYAAFSVTMMIGRLTGDYLIDRLGRLLLLLAGGCLLSIGIGLLLILPNLYAGLIGFALTGIGVANLVPIVFNRAGNQRGIASNIGIATVSFFGYSGFLLGPPAIGYLAHHFGLAEAMFTLVIFGVVVMVSAKKCVEK